jgi:hypothetical protein
LCVLSAAERVGDVPEGFAELFLVEVGHRMYTESAPAV